MNINKIIEDTDATLYSILSQSKWTIQQHNLYKVISRHTKNYEHKNNKYESTDDKQIIISNLLNQQWYKNSSTKPYFSVLFNDMKLDTHSSYVDDQCVNFSLTISFPKFKFCASYYRNKINSCTNFYVFFENGNTKAYMCLYSSLIGSSVQQELASIKIPETSKIYKCIGIDTGNVKQFDLVCFFSEIMFYYDLSGEVGNTQISYKSTQTLSDLVGLYSSYLLTEIESKHKKFIYSKIV